MRRLDREIRGAARATAEATAQECGVDLHVGGRNAEGRGHELRVLRLTLGSHPHLAALVLHPGHGIERFHAGVCEVGQFVFDVDLATRLAERGDGITLIFGEQARASEQCAALGAQTLRGERRARAVLPLDAQGFAALDGSPGVFGDHRHTAWHLLDVDDTTHGFGLRGVKGAYGRAELRGSRHDGHEHVWQIDVDAELRSPVDLDSAVETSLRLADVAEVGTVFQCHAFFGRNRQGGGRLDELSIGGATTIGSEHHAIFSAQLRCRHAPLGRCGLHDHASCRGADAAQGLVGGHHAHAAAGELRGHERMVESRVDAGDFDRQSLRIHVELFGEDHRQSDVDALTHFALADDHGDAIVGTDAHEGMRFEFLRCRLAPAHEVGAQQLPSGDATGDHADADQEVTASAVRLGAWSTCLGCAHAG